MRHVLLAFLIVVTGVLIAILVDRHVMRPRREADALVAAARPHASSSHEGSWVTAESLLAQAELRHRERADVRELSAQIAAGRAAQKQKDEVITAGAVESCLASLEKSGLLVDVARIRALTTLTKRDQHVECMKVQLQNLGAQPVTPPSISASVSH